MREAGGSSVMEVKGEQVKNSLHLASRSPENLSWYLRFWSSPTWKFTFSVLRKHSMEHCTVPLVADLAIFFPPHFPTDFFCYIQRSGRATCLGKPPRGRLGLRVTGFIVMF